MAQNIQINPFNVKLNFKNQKPKFSKKQFDEPQVFSYTALKK